VILDDILLTFASAESSVPEPDLQLSGLFGKRKGARRRLLFWV